MDRKLASIQRIVKLEPIEGADAIEKATVLGWSLVVKKGEFKVGDLCIYFEVDSLLPLLPEFDFLEKSGSKKKMNITNEAGTQEVEGYRLKTVRLRGQISQGLAFPISKLITTPNLQDLKEGQDVTAMLGVYKYEPPIPFILSGQARGVFPAFVPKTDETRLQTVPAILERYKDTKFYVTEKVDGTSMTVFVKDGEMHVCSRNMDLTEGDNTYWRVANKYNLKEKLANGKYAVQGELIGEGVQSNKLKIAGQDLLVFSVFNIEAGQYLNYEEMTKFVTDNELTMVPIVEEDFKLLESVDEMVKFATRKSLVNPSAWVEGLVFRPLKEMRDEDLGRLSFKVINPEFLLEYKE